MQDQKTDTAGPDRAIKSKPATSGTGHLSPEGLFLSANQHLCELLGYSRGELLQSSLFDLTNLSDLDELGLRGVGAGKAPPYSAERRLTRKNGTKFWAQLTISPVESRAGELLLVIDDISSRKDFEVAFAKLSDQLEQVLNIANEACWEWDGLTGQIKLNLGFLERFGYSSMPSPLTFDSWFSLIHPDDQELVKSRIEAHLSGETEHYESEHRLRQHSGGWRWVLARGKTVERDHSGRPIRVIGASIDITKQKQAEEERNKLEEMFQKAFKSSPVVVALSTLAEDRLIDVNAAFERITGYSRQEAVGKTTFELGLWSDPSDWGRLVQRMKQEGHLRDVECRYKRKTGELIVTQLSAEPIELAGRDCVVATVRDVTDAKHTEESLRASQKKLELHLQQMLLGVVEWTRDSKVKEWNPAAEAIFGYTRAEAVGQPMSFIIPAESRQQVESVCAALFAQTGGQYSSNNNITKDGRTIFCEWFNTPIVSEDGSAGGVMSLVRDVTKATKAEEERRRAEEAVKLSEARYRSLVETQSEVIARSDPRGCLTYVNDAYCQMFGKARSDLVGNTFEWTVLPEDVPIARRTLDDLQMPPHRASSDTRHPTPSGLKWISWENSAVLDDNGQIIEFQGVGRDITRSKKTELELRRSETMFSKAFRSSPVIMGIVRMADLSFIDVNEAFERHSGYSRAELVGRSLRDVGPQLSTTQLEAAVQRLGSEQRFQDLEFEYLAKGGDRRTCVASAEMIDVSGEPCVIVVAEDTTEQRLAERALRDSEARFWQFADTAPLLMWMSGPDGMCTEFNRGWMEFTGRHLTHEIGLGWTEGIHPADSKRYLDAREFAFRTRGPFTIEYRLQRHDGQYRWLAATENPRYSSDGQFLGYLCFCLDIHQQRESERARIELGGRLIAAQEDERKRVARELHDDIGQSLALLAIHIQTAQRSATSTQQKDQFQELWERTEKILGRISRLSHQLHSSTLDHLGLERGAEALCRDFSKQYQLEVKYEAKGFPSQIDSGISLCFFRILQESLRNIAKHSQARAIEVHLKLASGELHLRVKDNGIGFSTLEGGQGLGLLSMRERVQQVGGKFAVRSSPGHGTVIEATVACSASPGNADRRAKSRAVSS